MFTQLEMKMLGWMYNLYSKYFLIPFTWENGRMAIKAHQHLVWNSLDGAILLSTCILKLIQLCTSLENTGNDINGLVIHGILFLGGAAASLCKLNLWIHREELVKLINELLLVNSDWGNQKNHFCHPRCLF